MLMKWKAIQNIVKYIGRTRRDGLWYRFCIHREIEGWWWRVSDKMFPLVLPALGDFQICLTISKAKRDALKWMDRYVQVKRKTPPLNLNWEVDGDYLTAMADGNRVRINYDEAIKIWMAEWLSPLESEPITYGLEAKDLEEAKLHSSLWARELLIHQRLMATKG